MERAVVWTNSYAWPTLEVTTDSFVNMWPIPQDFTCDWNNLMPQIYVKNIPGTAVSLAMIVEDPDAPRWTFTHFIGWNIPFQWDESLISLETIPSDCIGMNDFGEIGWKWPCPQQWDRPHKYLFKIYALDRSMDMPKWTDRGDFIIAMHGNIISTGELIGEYARQAKEV